IEYGAKAIKPNNPSKESMNPDYFYLFSGWDQAFDYVISDLEIYPVFKFVKKTYTVTFLDGDSNVFNVQTINYGNHAIAPNGVPLKSPTDDVSYVFKAWDIDFTEVTSDLIVRPIYNELIRQYLVI